MTEEMNKEIMMEKIYTKGYRMIAVYIYYGEFKQFDINVLHYIKEFQSKLDIHGIGSQVQICTKESYTNIGINNCFKCEDLNIDKSFKWTRFALNYPIKCIKIKKNPSIDAIDLLKIILTEDTYEDEFVKVIIEV